MKLSSSTWWLVIPTVGRESSFDLFPDCHGNMLLLDSPDLPISGPGLKQTLVNFFGSGFKISFYTALPLIVHLHQTSETMKARDLDFLFMVAFFSCFWTHSSFMPCNCQIEKGWPHHHPHLPYLLVALGQATLLAPLTVRQVDVAHIPKLRRKYQKG